MSSSSSRRLRLRSRSRGVPPGSWSAPSFSPIAGSSSSLAVGTSTDTAIEPRWNSPAAGGASSRCSVLDRRMRPPRWPRSRTGSGAAALPRATWRSATSSRLSVDGPGLSTGGGRGPQLDAETDDDRRVLGLEHDGDREVGVVVGEDRQPHAALVVALDRAVVEHGVEEGDERLALVVVGQHVAEPGRGIAEPPGIGRAVLDDAERGGEVAEHAEVACGRSARHFSSGPRRWRAYGTRSRPPSSAAMLPGISSSPLSSRPAMPEIELASSTSVPQRQGDEGVGPPVHHGGRALRPPCRHREHAGAAVRGTHGQRDLRDALSRLVAAHRDGEHDGPGRRLHVDLDGIDAQLVAAFRPDHLGHAAGVALAQGPPGGARNQPPESRRVEPDRIEVLTRGERVLGRRRRSVPFRAASAPGRRPAGRPRGSGRRREGGLTAVPRPTTVRVESPGPSVLRTPPGHANTLGCRCQGGEPDEADSGGACAVRWGHERRRDGRADGTDGGRQRPPVGPGHEPGVLARRPHDARRHAR